MVKFRGTLFAFLYSLSLPLFAQSFLQTPSSVIVPAASSLQGGAGTASVISYAISGAEQLSTASNQKLLAQGLLTGATASIYAPITNYTGFITSIVLKNTSGSPVTGVSLYLGGTAAGNQIFGVNFAAGEQCTYTAGASWICIDNTGAALAGGGTTLTAGTGLSVSSGVISLITPVVSANGGSGVASPTAHSPLVAEGSSAFATPTPGTSGQLFLGQGASADPLFASMSQDCAITLTGVITCSKTNNVAFGPFATQTAPCSIGQGCTGQITAGPAFNALSPLTTLGDTLFENATPAGARLAGNTTATRQFMAQTGNGTISAAPIWTALGSSDIPNNAANTSGSAGSFTGSLAGDVTGTQGATVVGKINGTSMAGLATGILKNTTTTGVPSIATSGTDYAPGTSGNTTGIVKSTTGTGALTTAIAADFPTLNQSTTGNASTATALASTPSQCTGLQFATGVAASGNANCSTPPQGTVTSVTGTSPITSSGGATPAIGIGIPVVNQTGTNYTYLSTDRGKLIQRSNSGVAMADTLPTPATVGAGWYVTVVDTDTTTSLSMTTPAGAFTGDLGTGTTYNLPFSITAVLQRRVTFVTDGTNWYASLNETKGAQLFGTATVGHLMQYQSNTGLISADSGIVATTAATAVTKITNGYYDAAADFGMVGDQRVVFDGACSTGANTKVTSATAAFVSGDLGHRITLAGGGAAGAVLDGTISNIDSGTQITISGTTCATTVSAKGLQLGTSNATACASMVSVINSLSYGAAIIHFPLSSTGRWACPTKLIFTRSATLEGQGSATNQDAGDYSKVLGTALAWWGTDNDGGVAFDAFIEFRPVAPIASQNQSFPAPGIRHLSIDCRNGDQANCYAAVKLTDVVGFAIDDVFIMDPMVCFQMGTVDLTGVTAATGRGMMQNVGCRVLENTTAPVATAAATLTPTTIAAGSNNLVLTTSGQSISIAAANGIATPGYVVLMTDSGYRIPVKCTGGGGTTTLTGCVADLDAATDSPKLVTGANIVQMTPNSGSCLLMEGTTNTNTNLFSLDMGRFSTGANWGMGCIEAHNADSASFRQVVINGGNATNGGAINRIQHPGVVVSGSNAAAANASRNLTFWDGDAGTGGAESLGLTSAGVKLTAPAGPNYWTMYQLGNNNQAPTIENGSGFEWTANGGCQIGLRSYDQTAAVAYTAGTAKTIPGTAFQLGLQCIQTGVTFHWRYQLQKTTAAGTTARLTNIRIGTTGTQADANVCQFSNATTAAVDNGIVNIYYSITTGGTTASATGICSMMIESRQLIATAGGLISTLGTPVTVGTPTVFSAPSGAIWYANVSQTTGTAEVSTTSFGAGYVEKIGIQSPGP